MKCSPAISLLLAVCFDVTFAQIGSCGEAWQQRLVYSCPRRSDPWWHRNCCTKESEIGFGVSVKAYGCCSGLAEWMYIVIGVGSFVILASIITCCCCCCGCCGCHKSRDQRGAVVVYKNPSATMQNVHMNTAYISHEHGRY